MSSYILETVDQVADAIAPAVAPAVPQAALQPVYVAEDLADLSVRVFPIEHVLDESLSRESSMRTIGIAIAIQKRVSGLEDAEEVFVAAEAALEIVRDITWEDGAHVSSARHDPIFVPDHLRESSVLTCIVKLDVKRRRT